MLVGQPQHKLKHFLADFQWQTLACVRRCRVIGRSVARAIAEELGERTAVVTTLSDAALAVDAFEEADEQHAKVDARRNRRLTAFLFRFVILLAAALEPRVKLGRGEQSVEFLIERMAGRAGQVLGGNKECSLSL